MAHSTAKNNSSLTWARRFLSVYYTLGCRTSGNRASNRLDRYTARERTVLFAFSPPAGGRPRGTVECHFAHAQL